MANKQESMHDYYLEAKAIAQAEKDLGIERWEVISIEMSLGEGVTQQLYRYDLPRRVSEKYDWVFRWRAARYQCEHPKNNILIFHSPYRRVAGLQMGMQHDIDTLVAAKAQHSRQRNIIEEYVERQRTNLFFDENTDKELIKCRQKLKIKEENIRLAEERLKKKVLEYRSRNIVK